MTSHTERLHLHYTRQQMFDLVAEVERYPEFVPWVIAARIRHRKDHTVFVEMTMGTRLMSRQFSTEAALHRPHQIDINSHDPLFDRFEQRWTFKPANDDGTLVEYHVDVSFRSRLLDMLVGASLPERASVMVTAFRQRARQLYGDALPGQTS